MKIYNYDPASGAYTGEDAAAANPVRQNDWLIPAFATAVVPPSEQPETTRIFRNGSWSYARTADLSVVDDTPPQASQAEYETAIQAQIDATATGKQFRDGVTLASYANSTNMTWHMEALTFIAWRDAVWIYAYAELAKVTAGERTQPTVGAFLAELPVIQWPNV